MFIAAGAGCDLQFHQRDEQQPDERGHRRRAAVRGRHGCGFGNVAFTFNNAGPLASSITDIYWDDQAVFCGRRAPSRIPARASAIPGPAPYLPGGNAVGFSVSPSGAAADSNAPVQPMGVNPGEWVTLVWSIVSGKTFNDVIAALNLGGDQAGLLRIGIHVQGFANGGLLSFRQHPAAARAGSAAGWRADAGRGAGRFRAAASPSESLTDRPELNYCCERGG